MSRLNSMSRIVVVAIAAAALLSAPGVAATCRAAGLEPADPASVGFDAARLARIDEIVAQGLAEKKMPGCVVCVGRHGQIAWLKAYGHRQVEPAPVAMTTDTVFDMASITKPVATATSMMLLIERGRLSLSDKVASIIPEFAANAKGEITVRDLLLHISGLIPDNPMDDYAEGPEKSLENIYNLELRAPTGERFMYSDVNFMLLGDIVQRVSGRDVNEFARQEIYEPLGMTESGYLPADALQARAAPTEERNGAWMRGEVHDPRAYALGGVAGHAGLFSTAADLAIYAQMMLGQGEYQGVRILSPRTVSLMTRGYRVPGGLRGLGWDKKSGYSINKGELLSDAAFGHGGFTGTVLWIDPELDLFFIFLSNRVHPDGKGLVNPLAGRIATAIAAAVNDDGSGAEPAAAEVLTGIDVLQRDNFRELRGQRVGLITNHTGRNRDGVTTVQLLHEAEEVNLTALFSPEHGFEGVLDHDGIGDTRDRATGLKVHSLYGETRKPTPEMLADLDTVVFDIQDIGVRFYTYESTMGEAMRAAAEHKVRFVVLDRPNPINGVDVSGPILDDGLQSFVSFHTTPLRHGLTMGELARLFQKELKLEVDLVVIPCEGWSRRDYWDATGLTWINPSPNMRSLTEALLYPGIGILETTNVSVGRGTDTPFEVVGAPWIDGRWLAAELNARHMPGVTFVPIEFTPDSSKFAREKCGGINVVITRRDKFESVPTGFQIALQLRKLYPKEWETESFNRLLGNKDAFNAIVEQKPLAEVLEIARDGMRGFERRRAEYLLYE